ncbi:hypothetical protein PV328_011915, partial [Microctonus aethiopoides]
MVEVSRLLQAAVGGADHESVGDEDDDNNNDSDSNDDNDDNESDSNSASETNHQQNRKRKRKQGQRKSKKGKYEVSQPSCSLESGEARPVTSDHKDDPISKKFSSRRRKPVIDECERTNN